MIARSSRTAIPIITLCLEDEDGQQGWGECQPNPRFGESPEAVLKVLAALDGLDETALEAALGGLSSPCAANALDCALLDLAAKRSGVRVWAGLDMPTPKAVPTLFTLSLAAPAVMAEAAERAVADGKTRLKLKLGADGDAARLRAVRAVAPDAAIVVDANEGWKVSDLSALFRVAAGEGVLMVEQPLPAGEDLPLGDLSRDVPICADESCHSASDVPHLANLYDLVNIKLDKTGGLRPALDLAGKARARGLDYMVGCMICTSLGAAPGLVAAQGARFVDLDGPLLLAEDRTAKLDFDEAYQVFPPQPALWG